MQCEKEKIRKLKEYEEIYKKYVHLVGFVISKYITNEEDIRDLTDETFLHFFRCESNVSRDKIQAYLTTTAKNLSLNFLNASRTSPVGRSIETIEDSEKGKTISNILYNEFVDDLLTYLTQEEVDIIILHIVYEYTFYEIAQMLDKNYNTINSVYKRALKKYKDRRKT